MDYMHAHWLSWISMHFTDEEGCVQTWDFWFEAAALGSVPVSRPRHPRAISLMQCRGVCCVGLAEAIVQGQFWGCRSCCLFLSGRQGEDNKKGSTVSIPGVAWEMSRRWEEAQNPTWILLACLPWASWLCSCWLENLVGFLSQRQIKWVRLKETALAFFLCLACCSPCIRKRCLFEETMIKVIANIASTNEEALLIIWINLYLGRWWIILSRINT